MAQKKSNSVATLNAADSIFAEAASDLTIVKAEPAKRNRSSMRVELSGMKWEGSRITVSYSSNDGVSWIDGQFSLRTAHHPELAQSVKEMHEYVGEQLLAHMRRA